MTYENHDVELTAYALGELPPNEAAAVEARLKDDPAAAAEVDRVRETARRLEHALSAEASPPAVAGRIGLPRWVMLAAAASVVGGLTAGLVMMEDGRRGRVAVETVGGMESARTATLSAEPLDVEPPAAEPFAAPTVALARPEAKAVEDMTRAERERSAQRQVIVFRYNEAATDMADALNRGDFDAARTGVQRMRTARNTNPFIFNTREVNGFDAGIREVEAMLRERESAATGMLRQADRQTAESEARRSAAAPDRERAATLARLDDDADAAAAAGDVAGEAALRQQAEVVAGGPSRPQSPAPFGTKADPGTAAETSSGEFYNDRVAGPRLGIDTHLIPSEDMILPADAWRHAPPDDREDYDHTRDNDFASPADAPLSTFSVDVDTASYANVRRFLTDGQLPPADAVRIEELVNYFDYDYPTPALDDSVPFAADVAVAGAPWARGHKLVRIGLQAADVDAEDRPGANLVFLVDVSGSMQSRDKLPLVQRGLRTMLGRLDGRDTVSMVVYAGDSGVALPPTPGDDHATIQKAIDGLTAGGSTNGAAGIEGAYGLARGNFRDGGVNRVVLATDGDFNVGTTDQGSLVRLVAEQARSGVYLTVLGFGTGNLNDAMMEEVSNKGDGFYAYIDGEREAERVLGERMLSTVQAVAKDVKVQVEFNPAAVSSYRLIGYANRVMPDRDFADDTKDAGDVGAGHQVTALYEVIPVGVKPAHWNVPASEDLKYQRPTTRRDDADPTELATVKLRWKAPDAPKEQGTSTKAEFVVKDADTPFAEADDDLRFAAAVAGFGMLLREGEHRGDLTWPILLDLIEPMRRDGEDRREFGDLVDRAARLSK